MIDQLLEQRIKEYDPKNEIEQDNVLQEIVQSFILASLSKTQFFKYAAFHGGTCLKFFNGVSRFSEDLDFLLKEKKTDYDWKNVLDRVQADLNKQGMPCDINDKSKLDIAVKKAFLKTDSIGNQLVIDLPFKRYRARKVKVKLEIDCNPPQGSKYETHFLEYPLHMPVTTQTLESSFAGKSHALLCRVYTKGRDWYDFIWYVNKKIKPDYEFLKNALHQQGPWAGKSIEIDQNWYIDSLLKKIKEIDWKDAVNDVSRFIPTQEQENLTHWNEDFFRYHVNKLKETLGEKQGV